MCLGTYFTFWHYLIVLLSVLLFVLGTIISFKEKRAGVRNAMIFSTFLVTLLIAAFMIMAADKYTKHAQVTNLTNRRVLSNETIVYSGFVRNVGDYTIGEVTLEIKLVNRGHVSGNVKGGNFYKPSGFFDFFNTVKGSKKERKQQVIKEFVIARNLKPGHAKQFSVTLAYPPYFSATSYFTRVFAH